MYKKLIKTGLLILFLFHTINLPVSAKPTQRDCYEQFNEINISEIQKIFSNPESWTTYKGQEGYLLFTRKSPNINSVSYLFRLVSKALGKNFRQLGWQHYQGSVEDFLKERNQILDKQGHLKTEYIGVAGYVRYAIKYHKRNMQKTFTNVSAVLDNTIFQQLGWKQYHGSLYALVKEQRQILDENGVPKEKYRGMEGCAKYATDFHGENLQKAFINVSAILDKTIFQQLEWQQYQGSMEDFFKERNQILNKKGVLKRKYLGMDGYAEYAQEYYEGDMQKAFKNVSAVLDKTIFQQLGWRQYQGSVADFLQEKNQITDDNGNIKQEYLGMEGYAEYTEEYHQGNMQKAFKNVSAVLDKTTFQQSGWQQYQGLAESFLKERDQILDENGNIKEDYIGILGYARYANKYHKKNMLKAFSNVSAVLGSTLFKQLGWQHYQGSLYDLVKERKRILNSNGTLKAKYMGIEGYASYASEYHEGNMQKAFKNVSAVLDKKIFKQLEWKQYHGSVLDFLQEKKQILDRYGNINKEYLNMEGYARYAEEYHKGSMQKAFLNVSAVLDNTLFKQLRWQRYHGSVADFFQEKKQILDHNGNVKRKYLGMEGYAQYARQYYEGNMQKAFKNVSALLGKHLSMKELGLKWNMFQGSVSEYYNLLQLFKNHPPIFFKGLEGQKKVAKEIFQKHYNRAYNNVSALREMLLGSREAFTELNWSANLK